MIVDSTPPSITAPKAPPKISLGRLKKYEGMAKIPGGSYKMGTDDKLGNPHDGEVCPTQSTP